MSLQPLQTYRTTVPVPPLYQGPAASSQGPAASSQGQAASGLPLVVKTVGIAMSTVHRVRTLEEQYSYPDLHVLTNDEHWAMTPETLKSVLQQPDHFVL